VILIQKSLTSGPHLSDAARRTGPTRQRAVAAWLPRTAPPAARPPRSRRHRPDRLTHAAVAPTASPTAPPLGPPPCRPDRLTRRSPIAVVPRRRLRAGELPFPADGSPSRAVAMSAVRHARGPCPTWPWAAPHCASGLRVVSAQRHSN
jgi:hypothetical protein